MLREDIKAISSTRRDVRKFGLTVGPVLVVLAGLLWWWDRPAWPFVGAAGAGLVLSALVAPAVLKPLQKAWMMLAVILGWVMTRVILSILFFLAFTVVGLIGRVFGKEFLAIAWKRPAATFWNYRNPQPDDKRRTEMQF